MSSRDEQERIGVQLELPRSVVESVILAARRQASNPQDERERLARILLRSRQQRVISFPTIAFGEPGWDMILQLYVADRSDQPIDVSGLCASTGAPKTTALRHIDRLEELGLIARWSDGADGRRIFVQLQDVLRSQTERWLDSTRVALEIGAP